jgi:mRNA-degrading endonuclease YafQ of YafQ-DinJ toxin-antitoxin module
LERFAWNPVFEQQREELFEKLEQYRQCHCHGDCLVIPQDDKEDRSLVIWVTKQRTQETPPRV